MAAVAVFAMAWAVVRACLQSITDDEAGTYIGFVAPDSPNHWMPHSNNHVLNSLLMRLATTVFGLSELTVRLPALAGACVYVAACYLICRAISERSSVKTAVFACLVLNPYLSDFYAAARGYSLAAGFLTSAIAAVAAPQLRAAGGSSRTPERTWIAASVFLGLSLASNFAFAFIVAATWASLSAWTLVAERRRGRPELLRLAAASVLPGAGVVFVLASWTLLNWPRGQLFYGTDSILETFRTVMNPSLHEPNPEIANPLLLAAFRFIRPFLIPALCAAAVWQFGVLTVRRRVLDDIRARKTFELCLVTTAALAAAILTHRAAFQCFGLLLPKDRTGIYIVPLWTLAAGSLAAVRMPHSRSASTGGRVLLGLMAVLASYYALCVRSTYFSEWWSTADAKEAYSVLARYERAGEVREVVSRNPLTRCLEFYRRASGREGFAEFKNSPALMRGADAYAGYESLDRDLISGQGWRVVYRGRIDRDLVVAVRTEAYPAPTSGGDQE